MEETNNRSLKRSMRLYFTSVREGLSEEERSSHSTEICQRLRESLVAWKAHRLHTYLPMGKEVDIWPLIRWALSTGMEITIPKTLPRRELLHLRLVEPLDLIEGRFGTFHPREEIPSLGFFDVILVPGLSFDVQGNRLGYGAGYYDQFLKEQPQAIKVGICYADQLATKVPQDDHDVPMDVVITEMGLSSDLTG